ncbi:ATP-grasp domain-containing protein [Kitasatospora sp. NPDC059327]|uniref:ATP-grasp domain-containing protein n=1 Tax=Kitasatospora sp. NPDC059327 TaxID=3346803 RepID=UPI0036CA93C6
MTNDHPADGHKPLLLLIGSGAQIWREYMLRAMATRYRLHLLSQATPTWESPYIATYSTVNTLDPEAMIKIAKGSPEDFAGVLTYEETRVESAAVVATALGLRTSPVEAVHACRDKFAGRQALKAVGVPQAESIAVGDFEEARQAAERLGYPVVVKPRALSASNGVSLVRAPQDLAEAYREATAIWFDEVPTYERPVLVEEYLDGPEISVDAVCRDGLVTVLFVARKRIGYAPGFEEVGHLVRADDPLLGDPVLLQVLQDAHTAVGLTDTVTHTELRLTSAGPRVVEINARVGGDRIPYLGGLATGIEVGLVAADLAAGALPRTTASRQRVAAIRFLYPERDLTVESVDVDRERLSTEIHDVQVLAGPGRQLRLPPADHVRCRYALVVAVAATEQECEVALTRAAAAVVVRGAPLD